MTREPISYEPVSGETKEERIRRYCRLYIQRVTPGSARAYGATAESFEMAFTLKQTIGDIPIAIVAAMAEIDSVYLRLLLHNALYEEEIYEEAVKRIADVLDLDMASLPRLKSWDNPAQESP